MIITSKTHKTITVVIVLVQILILLVPAIMFLLPLFMYDNFNLDMAINSLSPLMGSYKKVSMFMLLIFAMLIILLICFLYLLLNYKKDINYKSILPLFYLLILSGVSWLISDFIIWKNVSYYILSLVIVNSIFIVSVKSYREVP